MSAKPTSILLIRPPSVFAKYAVTLNATPPISLAYLAGTLSQQGHAVRIIDAVGQALDQVYESHLKPLLVNGLRHAEILEQIHPDTRYIGISCLFTHEWPNIQKLVKEIHEARPDIRIVLGGEHVTAAPEYSLQSAPEVTALVLGEGEETFAALIETLENGGDLQTIPGIAYRDAEGIRQTPRRARIRNIDVIPWPRWDLVPLENYLSAGKSFGVDLGRTIPMLATRGCPFACTFCSSPFMWTQRYETRDPKKVVDEIEYYVKTYNVENIDFYDLTAIIHKDWVIRFCRELLDRGVRVTWQLPSGTRSEAIDAEVSAHLYEAGCRNLSYAPESGSPKTLKRIKKMVVPERMVESMKAAISNRLSIKANIIFGFPDETLHDVWLSLRFIWRMASIGVADVSIWAYSPYPGCELFHLLKERGRIREYDDDYFRSLLAYSDFTSCTSYDDYLSPRMIRFLRWVGMTSFYLVRYVCNPLRLFKTLRNIATGDYESRMEMALSSNLHRIFQYNRAKKSGDAQEERKIA